MHSKKKYIPKVGDIVIGNSDANGYGITKEGWTGVVEAVHQNGVTFDVSGFTNLEVSCFDLSINPALKVKFKKGDWVKSGKLIGTITGEIHGNRHSYDYEVVVGENVRYFSSKKLNSIPVPQYCVAYCLDCKDPVERFQTLKEAKAFMKKILAPNYRYAPDGGSRVIEAHIYKLAK